MSALLNHVRAVPLALNRTLFSYGSLRLTLTRAWRKTVNLDFSVLKPDFCWETPKLLTPASSCPPVPRLTPQPIRRFWAYVHILLREFSLRYYCPWYGIRYDNGIIDLPFGLLLKWSDGTRLEEAQTTQMMRVAGFPVPRILCYGEHGPYHSHHPVSILMTRMEGVPIWADLWTDHFGPDQHATIISELKVYIEAMRKWQNPWVKHGKEICSAVGTSIRSLRVPSPHPLGLIGPCKDIQEFHDTLIEPAMYPIAKVKPDYEEDLQMALRLHSRPHSVVFSHGDLLPFNILVNVTTGHLTGFIDWESAGWYPDYWDYSTGMRTGRSGWWYEAIKTLAGSELTDEDHREDVAQRCLGADAFAW
ncbi:MAG: hypothetical protein Q9190_005420 [Brigantiaea leucoxantha]